MKTNSSGSVYGSLWAREESLLAFELYCRIPFQKTKANNPAVVQLAQLLGRTSASVARKLGNFGAFDPALQKMNISGLTHTSRLDREIWDEFNADWNSLVIEANELRMERQTVLAKHEPLRLPAGPSEKMGLVKQRLHQAFFRDAVLSSYDATCCVTGLTIREALVASHIVPWNMEEKFRADPTNGLCLSATFDRLFDCGLMTVTNELTVRFSTEILNSHNTVTQSLLSGYQDRPIRKPTRFLPSLDRLQWHNKKRFRA
jgi:putative restriction endonuclease